VDKKELKEWTELLISNAFANLRDAGIYNVKYDEILRKLEYLFETEFEQPDFLVRLGFFFVEVGLYPERFRANRHYYDIP